MNQSTRIKMYKSLKVFSYCMGLPLFLFMVTATSLAMYYGHEPFGVAAAGEGLFALIKISMSSRAVLGIWIAVGIVVTIWAAHIIMNRFVKSTRVRLVLLVSVMLVTMLVPVFIIDSVYTKKINEIAAAAPEGVKVLTYTEHLTNFRELAGSNMEASGRQNGDVEKLIKQVADLRTTYNINYHVSELGGTAKNIGNRPVYYHELGLGEDFNKDGVIDELDRMLVMVEPTGGDPKTFEGSKLVINGTPYPYFYCVSRTPVGAEPYYLWYDSRMNSTMKDGPYGYAAYNESGLLSDGTMFGLETALKVIVEYNQSKIDAEAILSKNGLPGFDDMKAQLHAEAVIRQEAFYADPAFPERAILMNRELGKVEDFTLTSAELNEIISMLMGTVGALPIFDFLFDTLGITEKLAEGWPLSEVLEMVGGLVTLPEGIGDIIADILGADCKLVFRQTPHPVSDKLQIEAGFIDGIFNSGTGDDDVRPNGIITIGEDFTLTSIVELVEGLLASLDIPIDLMSIINLLMGSDHASIDDLLAGIVEGLYWYQSPAILPVWEFYTNDTLAADAPINLAAKRIADHDRAYYTGAIQGSMVGSIIIGDSVGDGSGGKTIDLVGAQSLLIALDYQSTLYPILTLRFMLVMFASISIFAVFISYVFADKQKEWENGNGKPRVKKRKGTDIEDVPVLENKSEEVA